MFGEEKKDKPKGLALLIGGAKPEKEKDSLGGDRKEMAEKAFVSAIKSGSGVADALEELMSAIDDAGAEDDEALEPDADDEDSEIA